MATPKRFMVAQAYARMYGFLKDNLGIHIRGLGFLLRQINQDHNLLVQGRRLYFAHRLAEAYARPLYGQWNEPETHALIACVMDRLMASFVDVGANIGEIMVDVAAHPSCVQAIGFEPNPAAVEVIKKNIELNLLSNCSVICKALGHEKNVQAMSFGSHSPSASLLLRNSPAGEGVVVEISTLDSELPALVLGREPIILLVDVEGYELNVIRGGRAMIGHLKPLIIFEYHRETQKAFRLADLQHELGEAYEIYRVRQDAMLDREVDAAWNCVAVPRGSDFERILRRRILG